MAAVMTEQTTKRVEFVGLPSPFADPAIQAMKARGQLTKKRRDKLYEMERKRQIQGFCRYPGVTARTIGTRHGLSRDYRFGPREFVQEMAIEDIEKLMQMHDAHPQAFRVLDDILVL